MTELPVPLRDILQEAPRQGATDIHLDGMEDCAILRMRVEGEIAAAIDAAAEEWAERSAKLPPFAAETSPRC